MEDNEKLAWDHWNYIEGVLRTQGIEVKQLETIKYHYTTAFIHGYKHGVEDSTNINRSKKRS